MMAISQGVNFITTGSLHFSAAGFGGFQGLLYKPRSGASFLAGVNLTDDRSFLLGMVRIDYRVNIIELLAHFPICVVSEWIRAL